MGMTMQLLRKVSPHMKHSLILSSREILRSVNIFNSNCIIVSHQLKLSTLSVTTSTANRIGFPSIPTIRTAMSSISEPNFIPGISIPCIPRIPVGDAKNNDGNSTYYFPVNRIYCVGKNYTDHVKEMGGNPRNEAPCFFMKPSNAIVPCGYGFSSKHNSSITQIVYPLGTDNLHYEVELVVAIGNPEGGTNDGVTNVSVDDASKIIYGYGVGIDLTRRDIQSHAKKNGLPWCTSKGFDSSTPISNIYPITLPHVYEQLHLPLMKGRSISSPTNEDSRIDNNGNPESEKLTELWLNVNGKLKQSGYPIREMIWSVPEIISHLSQLYTLRSGDIIFTGTPAGVSNIIPSDTIRAGMNVLGALEFVLLPRNAVATANSTTTTSTS
jgi:fumarylpyruvate hydrolase